MIKVTIREAAKREGIKTAAELSRSVGVTKPTAKRLLNNEYPVDLPTLDKICWAWKCDLSELIKYVRNGKPK